MSRYEKLQAVSIVFVALGILAFAIIPVREVRLVLGAIVSGIIIFNVVLSILSLIITIFKYKNRK